VGPLDRSNGDVPFSATLAFAVCFATAVVWGLSRLGVVAFDPVAVAAAAAVIASAVVLAGRR
jgi:hypothetical protein